LDNVDGTITREPAHQDGFGGENRVRFKIFGAAVLFLSLAQSSFGVSIYDPCLATSGPTACTFDGSGRITVAGGTITFNSDVTALLNMFTFSGATGVFPAALNGTQQGIQSLGPEPIGIVFSPAIPFYTVGALNGLNLNFIQAGQFTTNCSPALPTPALPGQTCTPPLTGVPNGPPGPFNFTNVSDINFGLSSTAQFSFAGVSADGQAHWSTVFTVQFLGQSFQQVLGQLATTGSVSNTYSQATLVLSNNVPEPGTLVLMGAGLIGLAGLLRRRTAK
jgi:hypothetical protein